MTTTLILIIAYVGNVFLNRWLNKMLYKLSETAPISPVLWFIPIATTISLLIIIAAEKVGEVKKTWFTGKNW